MCEVVALGEFSWTFVCTGERQLLGLSTAAAHMQFPLLGVSVPSAAAVTHVVGCCWDVLEVLAVEG